MYKILLIGLSLVMISIPAITCHASMPVVDPYVDFYVPDGIDEETSGEFKVDTPRYSLTYNCGRGVITGLWAKKPGSADVQLMDRQSESAGSDSHVFSVCVDGVWYSNSYDKSPKYMHIRKSGKYMWEVLIEDIKLRNRDGKALPLTISETFYFWPDKIYTFSEVKPTEDISGTEYIELSSYFADNLFDGCNNGKSDQKWAGDKWVSGDADIPDSFTLFSEKSGVSVTQSVVVKNSLDSWRIGVGKDPCGIMKSPKPVSRLLLFDRQRLGSYRAWKPSDNVTVTTAYYVSPEGSSKPGLMETACDKNPLDGSQFTVSESTPAGASFKGFDSRMGCYNIELVADNVFYWETDPNFISDAGISINNDNLARNIRMRTYEAPYGNMRINLVGSCSMLCDADKYPTGIPVQTSKKWDGEIHPNYHETYVSVPFASGESQTFWHRKIYHRWGTKTMVGIPSLDLIDWPGVYGPWYETHIGNCETVCYALDDRIHSLVQDFRAQAGTGRAIWYDNAGGAALTSLRIGGKVNRLKRRAPGLRWESVGPNLAQFSWVEQTFPGLVDARTTVTSTLIPSLRNSRVFFRYKTVFNGRQKLDDIRTDLRIFTLNEENYGAVQVPGVMSYLDANGKITDLPLSYGENKWACKNVPLSADKPFVAGHSTIDSIIDPVTYHAGVNNNGFVVHSFKGRIGGRKIGMGDICLNAFTRVDGKCEISLGPDVNGNEILPGDYVDVLLEMFTWNPADGNTAPIEAERLYNPTKVRVLTGKKISDFPASIRASDNTADFTVTGGVGYNAIIASGFDSRVPVLEEYVERNWKKIDQGVKGKDWWQTDYDPVSGKYTFTFALPAPENGGTKRYRISN